MLLLTQLFVVDPLVIVAIAELPIILWLLWLLTRNNFGRLMLVYLLLFVWRFLKQALSRENRVKRDEPLLDVPQSHPGLAELLRSVRRDFRKRPYRRVAFPLSPRPWNVLGCDAAQLRKHTRVAVIPVGCLAMYSIFDLRCELAHALVRYRPRVIITVCEANLERLLQMVRIYTPNRARTLRSRFISRLAAAYAAKLTEWHLLADLDADAQIAAKYGSFAVSGWAQRAYFASYSVPECITITIEPLVTDGVLLPIAEACRAHHLSQEADWRSFIMSEMAKAEKESARISHPLVIRLGALQHGLHHAGGFDPRPASTLVSNLAAIEENAVRQEINSVRHLRLATPGLDEIAITVVLPRMRQELERNADLIKGSTWADIPSLFREAHHLALYYVPHPRYLLAAEQRRALIPGFLSSFLTVELVNAGWSANYSPEDGLTLSREGKTVHPALVVDDLAQGKISDSEFVALLG